MKTLIFVIAIIAFAINSSFAQKMCANSGIDIMLINGNYGRVIDTCKQILAHDSLNPDIYYKLGIAYQNILDDDQSLNSFYQAARLNPDNKVFSFMLAKGYYGKEKYNLAEPLLRNLFSIDSTNWLYAYYLTGIYMQNNKYDDAIIFNQGRVSIIYYWLIKRILLTMRHAAILGNPIIN